MSLKESKKKKKKYTSGYSRATFKSHRHSESHQLVLKQPLKASLKISKVWSYRKLDRDHISDLTWNGNLTAPKKCDMGCMTRRWAMAAKLRFEKGIKEICPNKQEWEMPGVLFSLFKCPQVPYLPASLRQFMHFILQYKKHKIFATPLALWIFQSSSKWVNYKLTAHKMPRKKICKWSESKTAGNSCMQMYRGITSVCNPWDFWPVIPEILILAAMSN